MMPMVQGIALFEHQLNMDIWVKKGLAHMAGPFFDSFFSVITNLGSPTCLVLLTGFVSLFLVWEKRRMEGGFLAASMLIGWQLMGALKVAFARPRPAGEHLTSATGYSFPSGHSMLSLIFYGFIAYLIITRWENKKAVVFAAIAAILVLLIGMSRVYLNVHYASDVLGGYCIGATLLLISIKAMNWLRVRLFNRYL